MTQEALAELVGRTADWLGKAENNRIDLDRISVLRQLADALDVTLGDLVGDSTLLERNADSGVSTVSQLRTVLMDYRKFATVFDDDADGDPPALAYIEQEVHSVFSAYQASRFGLATSRAPLLLIKALAAVRAYDGVE